MWNTSQSCECAGLFTEYLGLIKEYVGLFKETYMREQESERLSCVQPRTTLFRKRPMSKDAWVFQKGPLQKTCKWDVEKGLLILQKETYVHRKMPVSIKTPLYKCCANEMNGETYALYKKRPGYIKRCLCLWKHPFSNAVQMRCTKRPPHSTKRDQCP